MLLISFFAGASFAQAPLPLGLIVTSVNIDQGKSGATAEITINNALTIREISVQNVGGRTLVKFPQSVSKHGKIFPQVRLTSRPAREAVYAAIEKKTSSSQWAPLTFEVAKITRYGKKSALKAFVVVIFGGGVEVECRVISGKSGLFVGWPARKEGNRWLNQVTIEDQKLKDSVESAVIAAYEK